jgi:hypothetical protein
VKGEPSREFYDLYLLGDGKVDLKNVAASADQQRITDVILADYAKPVPGAAVYTFYRAIPYEGGRATILDDGTYERYRKEFEDQISGSILPLLGVKDRTLQDLRVSRWGHPLPLAAKGLIADGVPEKLTKPLKDRVFFVHQDNWALPAFETSLTEALNWSPKVEGVLKK